MWTEQTGMLFHKIQFLDQTWQLIRLGPISSASIKPRHWIDRAPQSISLTNREQLALIHVIGKLGQIMLVRAVRKVVWYVDSYILWVTSTSCLTDTSIERVENWEEPEGSTSTRCLWRCSTQRGRTRACTHAEWSDRRTGRTSVVGLLRDQGKRHPRWNSSHAPTSQTRSREAPEVSFLTDVCVGVQ